jgi:phosphatidylglycerol lysyltransferase
VSYLLLFLGTLVEADVALIAAAFLAHRGYLELPWVILVCIAATFTANQFWFWLGRLRGRTFVERKAETDRRFQLTRGWLARRGTVLIPVSRFLYGFRAAIPAAYGASGASPVVFTWLDGASAVVWGIVIGAAGYFFGDTLAKLVADLQHYELLVLVFIAATATVIAIRRRRGIRVVVTSLRRPFEATGQAGLRLMLLVRDSSRLLVAKPHGRLAVFAVVMGSTNIVSAMFGTRFLHADWLTAWLPFEVTHGSRALMLLVGVALTYLGRGLARRKRLAWSMAMGLAALSAVLHLTHHGAVLRGTLAALFGLDLWLQRHRFHARTDPARLRHALIAAPVLTVALTLFGLAGLREFKPVPRGLLDPLRTVWLLAGFQDVPARAPLAGWEALAWSVRLLFVLSAGYVLTAALAPVAWREFRSAIGRADVGALAWTWGVDSMSYFAKQKDKRHFSVNDRAFLGFRVTNRVAVVAGDPIGEEDAIPATIAAFTELCRTNDWVPAFYETSGRYLEAYAAQGLKYFTIGQEAVLNLAAWSLSGGAVAKVRQFVNKVHREAPDVKVVEYRRHGSTGEDDEQLEEVSAEWLETKSGGEMGFNLGIFSVEDLHDKRTVIARRGDGTIEAFVTWLPYRAGRALVLDAMRHRKDAQPGVMDLLIAESALLFKKEGLDALSLAMAPLANVSEEGPGSPYDRGVKLIFEHLSAVYGYRTLFQYKKKFAPSWEARYLVFPRADLLARIAYTLIRVHYSHR